MASNALQYLITHFIDDNWHGIHEDANDASYAPYAPWWRYEAPADLHFCANPSAEEMRYLINVRAMATEISELLEHAIVYIKTTELDLHELLCFIREYECQRRKKVHRLEILSYLLCHGFRQVNVEPN